jgi:hypothetical protein
MWCIWAVSEIKMVLVGTCEEGAHLEDLQVLMEGIYKGGA